jgi:hypothetical protein
MNKTLIDPLLKYILFLYSKAYKEECLKLFIKLYLRLDDSEILALIPEILKISRKNTKDIVLDRSRVKIKQLRFKNICIEIVLTVLGLKFLYYLFYLTHQFDVNSFVVTILCFVIAINLLFLSLSLLGTFKNSLSIMKLKVLIDILEDTPKGGKKLYVSNTLNDYSFS